MFANRVARYFDTLDSLERLTPNPKGDAMNAASTPTKDAPYPHLARNLRQEMAWAGMTEDELVVEVDASAFSVRRWLRGESLPQPKSRLQLAKLFAYVDPESILADNHLENRTPASKQAETSPVVASPAKKTLSQTWQDVGLVIESASMSDDAIRQQFESVLHSPARQCLAMAIRLLVEHAE